MLLDTGATGISIDRSVAEKLGLQPHSERQDVHGLGGRVSVNTYSATLFLTVQPVAATPVGSSTLIGLIFPTVHGVKELQANQEAHNLKPSNGLPVIGILGRAFLQFTRFTYDGVSGNLDIEIDESVQHPRKG